MPPFFFSGASSIRSTPPPILFVPVRNPLTGGREVLVASSAREGRRWTVRRVLRIAARTLGVTAIAGLVVLAVVLGVLLGPMIPDPSLGFMERRGEVAVARVTSSESLGDAVLEEVTLVSDSGLEVELSVRVPRDATSPRPLVVLLAGQRTGRDAARYAADSRGVVVAALSYPYRRDPDAGTVAMVLDLPDIQRSLLDTPPAILLATDWLIGRPYVDPDRVELAGGSLGAFFVPVAGALEPRFRRVWLVHGAGDPGAVLEHGLREHVPFAPLRGLVARLLTAVAGGHHLAPEKWVGRIAPREVIVISARDDDSMPRESVEVLHRALGEPSEIIWMDGGHVLPRREEIIERLTDLVFSRIAEGEGVSRR